ncbi:exodeoxyribonuclease V subunit gamma [Serratia microhaemolytica]|uniref:exodeoxyribonuclease V subunit gamma n=1 Tax=Serratia microhaemolytica TaxID=2675110 RepID=UPI000FDE3786|nr:exodeoxyribonuclease V subunit gamma [Serratia microhaemolytica]
MFTVYHSNQLDLLTTVISTLIGNAPLADPFQSEVVLVQSPGMAQWLQMQLADKIGIAANITFPLPATFIWQMFTKVLPGIPQESAFSKDAMCWKLMQLLPALLIQPEFAALQYYLSDDDQQRKIHQLASRIADLFDQYLVFRPHWLERWQQGETVAGLADAQQWQAALWRALVAHTEQLQQPQWQRANLYREFINQLNRATDCPPGLPSRVFICGISALPPIYLDALQALGKHIDIHLLFTNPCRYYWGDIQDYAFLARLQSRTRRRYQQLGEQPLFRQPQQASQLFNAEGEQQLSNPLLASWGKLGRDHLYLLTQMEQLQEFNFFVDIPADNLLHTLQHDMLELEDHALVASSAVDFEHSGGKRLLDRQDRSVSLHLCHSALREVEVLQDQLLAMLAEDPQLTIRDIIVMVADIDSYAPYIQAVFGHATAERYLPFAISDRKARHAHPVLQGFLSLLELPQSRFSAEQVLALLDVPALAARFAIDQQGVQLLRQWVAEAGVRWGLDDDSVRDLSLPSTGQHTWRFGMVRMLLGYAMTSEVGDWQGVLPYDESNGLRAELVGQLAALLTELSHWRQVLSQSQPLAQWQPLCQQLLASFFIADSETQEALALINEQWQKVINFGLAAGYHDSVPLTILRDELTGRLDQQRISQRFLAGQLNFCTLMPMRSIPFKVVCLLGMNDGIYPRSLPPLGFDLMAQQSQRGDRSRRDDDRYLFLEALLSAQQRLYISFIGRAIEDNSERFPSVLVTELLEYLEQSHYLAGDEACDLDSSAANVRAHLLTQHSRMPFAAENFQPGSAIQSYAAQWLPAAAGQGTQPGGFSCPLQPLERNEISLEQLLRFYRHPVKAFFQQRLGVYFELENTELEQEEPFELDPLKRYQWNSQLLNSLITGAEPQQLYQRMRSSGSLPYGAFGEIYWQSQLAEMSQLAERIRPHYQQSETLELALDVGTMRITGWLYHVQPSGLLRWRAGQLRVVDAITLWLEHLIYCGVGGQGESRSYGSDSQFYHFPALTAQQAKALLQPWISGYQHGMTQPLLLLARSGWAWLEKCYQPQTQQIDWSEQTQSKARSALQQTWREQESQDPYLQRIMRQLLPEQIDEITATAECYLLAIRCHNINSRA